MNLKQLALHLGLSPTTVSRALNGFPEVSEKTRKRVQLAALDQGYAPSQQARNLATGKSFTIGHLVPTDRHQMINPHFADFFHGACKAYSSSGYDSLLRMVSTKTEESSYKQLVQMRKVDGFVVHGPRVDDPRIELLQSLKVPFIVHGRCSNILEDKFHWLDVDNVNAFKRATNLLIDLGHKKIGLLNGQEWMNFASDRRKGFEMAMAENNLHIDPSWLHSEDMTEPYGYEAMLQILKENNPPTAIVCASILPALGAQRALQEKGLTIGKDVSIVIFDDHLSFTPNSGDIPMFTSVKSSISEAGFAAGKMLLDFIKHPSQKPKHQLWQADLVIGRSTLPPSK